MGVLGEVVAMGKEFGSAWYNNRQAEKRQREAQDFSAQQNAQKYQTQVKDLKAAGLNPMLAVNQGASAPSSSAASSSGKMDLNAATNQSKIASAQEANIEADTENKKYEKRNLIAVQEKLSQEVMKVRYEVDEIDQKIKTGKATEQEIVLRQELTKRQTQLTDMQFKLAEQTLNINKPEEMASATQAAQISAHVNKVLQPVIDALGGVSKIRKPK